MAAHRVISAGLWIASDNLQGSKMCGVQGLAGLCLLPYPK